MIYIRNNSSTRATISIAGVLTDVAAGASFTTANANRAEVDAIVKAMNGDFVESNPTIGVTANLGAPAAKTASIDNIVSAKTDLSVAGTLTIAAQPIHPRNVRVTVTDAAGNNLAGTVTVTGTSSAGTSQVEVITVLAATLAYVGVKAFASVTTIAFDFGVTGAAGDTIKVGDGDILGLPILGTGLVLTKIIENGANVVPVQATHCDAVNNCYKPVAAPDGTKVFIVMGTYTP